MGEWVDESEQEPSNWSAQKPNLTIHSASYPQPPPALYSEKTHSETFEKLQTCLVKDENDRKLMDAEFQRAEEATREMNFQENELKKRIEQLEDRYAKLMKDRPGKSRLCTNQISTHTKPLSPTKIQIKEKNMNASEIREEKSNHMKKLNNLGDQMMQQKQQFPIMQSHHQQNAIIQYRHSQP